jgi:hypothetical protein
MATIDDRSGKGKKAGVTVSSSEVIRKAVSGD